MALLESCPAEEVPPLPEGVFHLMAADSDLTDRAHQRKITVCGATLRSSDLPPPCWGEGDEIGATVLAVSAYYLHKLALAVHMPVQLAWSLPVALDTGAAFGTVCWIVADDGSEIRRFGRAFALSCLGGTLAGNGLAHLLDFHVITVDPWLAVGVGAVYPPILFAIVHLVLLLRREQSATATEPVEDTSPIDQEAAAELAVIDRPRLRRPLRHRLMSQGWWRGAGARWSSAGNGSAPSSTLA